MMDLYQSGSRETAAACRTTRPAAALEKRLEGVAFVAVGDVAGFRGVEDEHVGRGQFLGRGECRPAAHGRAALGQQGRPLGEKTRMVMGAGTVGLWTGTDVDPEQRLGVQREGAEEQESGETEVAVERHGEEEVTRRESGGAKERG
jgi:hypothetical protein